MSKVSAFAYTNQTVGTNTLAPYFMKLTSNYSCDISKEKDGSEVAKMNNVTAPVDQEELVALKSRMSDKLVTGLNIQYPSKINKYVEYSVRVDELLSTTDTADASFRVDEPIVCSIAFRHPRSGNIQSSHVLEALMRAISALQKEDGTWRFDDLMRSCEKPYQD